MVLIRTNDEIHIRNKKRTDIINYFGQARPKGLSAE
jgi:hypothetical protein